MWVDLRNLKKKNPTQVYTTHSLSDHTKYLATLHASEITLSQLQRNYLIFRQSTLHTSKARPQFGYVHQK